jgi:hypothetical protein
MREGIGAKEFWWGYLMEKRILERCRHKRDGNIKTILQTVGWQHDLYPVQDRDRWWAVVKAVMKLRIP